MVFSVTYYLKLGNAIIVYCISNFTNKGQIACVDIIRTLTFLLGEKYINSKIL